MIELHYNRLLLVMGGYEIYHHNTATQLLIPYISGADFACQLVQLLSMSVVAVDGETQPEVDLNIGISLLQFNLGNH